MRALDAGRLSADDVVVRREASACLGCRACEPVCPAGVPYGALLETWRAQVWRGRRRPLLARALCVGVRTSLPARTAALVRRPASTPLGPGPHLLLGCAERVLFPGVSRAARRLDPSLDAPSSQGCCGALHAHNGAPEVGRQMALRLGAALPGRIVTTSGGCAAHLVSHLGADRVLELSQHLSGWWKPDHEVRVGDRLARVAVSDSCHLANALGVRDEPRRLVSAVAELVELSTAGVCCGAAGSYSLLEPKRSREILSWHLSAIAAADPDFVVVVNPGCQRQLARGLRRHGLRPRVMHLAELLALSLDEGRSERPLRPSVPRSDRQAWSVPSRPPPRLGRAGPENQRAETLLSTTRKTHCIPRRHSRDD
jgi:glycolate oxidase iron-sulfur subunit